MLKFSRVFLSTVAVSAMAAFSANASELSIIFDDTNPAPKAGFEAAVEAFKAENPDINVSVSFNDREAHKTAIGNFLTDRTAPAGS